MANKGWIHLYRSIQDSELWDSEEPYCKRAAWIELLLNANHKEANVFDSITCKRGQFVTSKMKLRTKWHWHHSKLVEFLDALVSRKMIEYHYVGKAMVITIINYDKYQENTNKGSVTTVTDSVTDNVTDSVTDNVTDNVTDSVTQTRMKKNDIKNELKMKKKRVRQIYD